MANSEAANADPADALQGLINDVLIQTGKALKTVNRDGKQSAHAQLSLQTKMPEIIESFHWKLDDLESEITRAKAALQRDLDRIQEARRPVQPPAPVEPQTKSPMAIDLESSREPSPENKSQVTKEPSPQDAPAEPSVPPSMAPFPDMGVSFQSPTVPTHQVKLESAQAPPAMMASMGDIKLESKLDLSISQPPQSGAPEAPMDDLFDLGGGGGDGTGGNNNSEFHFTDMTFSLAPPTNDSQSQPLQQQSQVQDAPMDISFGSGDMSGDMLSLESLLPPDNAVKSEPQATASAAVPAPARTSNLDKPSEAKIEKPDSTNLDDLFNLDGNTNLDGMDLDMNMSGEGGDGSTFDDMYFGDMTEMEHGKFDDAFFGIQ
ncbi:hypothetical protein CTRI78_v009896 [Colletotrichum trifolii]|uniref:Uncharacterized protein n=1 Tax=Colletotrichum trifolii TaxID=5466 RepID=A0A4R8QU10_COLTR|nr:hypothetical protein CTRI78_v009896 [Colletotrichum trifolii]